MQKTIVRRLKFVKDERQRTKLILELKAIEQGRAKYPNGEEMDADYRRMKYARYADDFLVGNYRKQAGCATDKRRY